MKLFIDSADLDEIKKADSYGIIDGVTTNPSLMKKAVDKRKKGGKSISLTQYIKQILRVARGTPVSLEVTGTDYATMVAEGKKLYTTFNPVAKNVYVKIPVNPCLEAACDSRFDGIRAIRTLSRAGIPINCTLVFTPEQALLAAKAGAKFISPFVGREDDYIRTVAHLDFEKTDYYPSKGFRKGKKVLSDNGVVSGVDLIAEIATLFKKQKVKAEILAASIRNARQFREVALAGADIATLPLKTIDVLLRHSKSVEGMKTFVKDVVPEYAMISGARRRKVKNS